MKWFYIDESVTDGDRRQGPFSLTEIQEMARQNIITAETLVWHSGMENWTCWKELEASIQKEQADEIIKQTLDALIKEKELQSLKPNYASFWTRALAYIIDVCILSLIATVTMIILHSSALLDTAAINTFMALPPEELVEGDKLLEIFEIKGMKLFLWITSITQFLYFFLFNWKKDATPGKLFLKIKIIKADGSRLGLKGSLVRFICSSISSFTFLYLYGLAYVVALVDPEKRTFHDWIAKTRVVHKGPEK